MSTTTAPAPDTKRAPKKFTKAQLRKRLIRRVGWARAGVQLGFATLILVAAVRHQTEKNSGQPSVDALCPFGAAETLITFLTTGHFITKIHPSNMVLGAAVLIAALLVGNVFCGWICPMGAVQDLQMWIKKKLHIPSYEPPAALDRVLRYGRFVVLALVIYMSVTTSKLWFAGFDPYVTLFSLHWLFEFSWANLGTALLIAAVVFGGSMVINRMWCRYLCPLGAMFTMLSRFPLLRLRRFKSSCTECRVCDKPCPVNIKPSEAAPFVNGNCIGCLECVTQCPVPNTLKVEGPVLLGTTIGLRPDVKKPRAARVPAGAGAGSKEA